MPSATDDTNMITFYDNCYPCCVHREPQLINAFLANLSTVPADTAPVSSLTVATRPRAVSTTSETTAAVRWNLLLNNGVANAATERLAQLEDLMSRRTATATSTAEVSPILHTASATLSVMLSAIADSTRRAGDAIVERAALGDCASPLVPTSANEAARDLLLDAALAVSIAPSNATPSDDDTGCSRCGRDYDGNAQCPCGIGIAGTDDNDASSLALINPSPVEADDTSNEDTRTVQPGPVSRRRPSRNTATHQVCQHIEQQRRLALQQNDALNHELVVSESDHGLGLFAAVALGPGYCIHYFGQYFDNGAAVSTAHLTDLQYVIAQNGSMALPHFDGAAIPDQLATRANHSTSSANAELVWDDDYSDPGQPMIRLTHPVAVGEEILVDYGPHYDYTENHFRRFDSSLDSTSSQSSSDVTDSQDSWLSQSEPAHVEVRRQAADIAYNLNRAPLQHSPTDRSCVRSPQSSASASAHSDCSDSASLDGNSQCRPCSVSDSAPSRLPIRVSSRQRVIPRDRFSPLGNRGGTFLAAGQWSQDSISSSQEHTQPVSD